MDNMWFVYPSFCQIIPNISIGSRVWFNFYRVQFAVSSEGINSKSLISCLSIIQLMFGHTSYILIPDPGWGQDHADAEKHNCTALLESKGLGMNVVRAIMPTEICFLEGSTWSLDLFRLLVCFAMLNNFIASVCLEYNTIQYTSIVNLFAW